MDEIIAFLSAYPPFDRLPPAAVALAASHLQIEYFAADQTILAHGGEPSQFLYLIRKGRVDLLREQDGREELFDSLGPGEAFGYPSLIRGRSPLVTARTKSETLTYLLPAPIFERLRAEYAPFADFFAAAALDRLGFALKRRHAEAEPVLFQHRLRDLVRRSLVAIGPDASVREAAQLMREHNVSSLLIDLPPYGLLDQGSGIITDRDLRNRVIAAGLPDSTPLRDVMTAPAVTLPADSLVFEALLLMLERGIHHLPVTEDGVVTGMITHTDILRRQSSSPLLLPRHLERATTLDELRDYAGQVVATAESLLAAGARVTEIGRVVAVANDALIRRILHDVEAALGAPPAPYAWLILGSGARLEQSLRTDQDHALVFADDHPPEAPNYFSALAERVTATLEACGFPRCPGNVMATNPRWRQPRAVWQSTFARWIEQPDEENLLRSSIFFDLRQLHGELDAVAALRPVIARAKGNTLFLARLARAALRTSAPLTFFRQVALERRGDQDDLLDLKQRGTGLIVDLARLFALEAGRPETNSVARLRAAWPEASLSEVEAESLINAFELLSLLRLRHQLAQLRAGQQPGNLVSYHSLGAAEQHELKNSLQAVARVQRGLANAYQTGRIV
jgi:CBS domain-containing protein